MERNIKRTLVPMLAALMLVITGCTKEHKTAVVAHPGF